MICNGAFYHHWEFLWNRIRFALWEKLVNLLSTKIFTGFVIWKIEKSCNMLHRIKWSVIFRNKYNFRNVRLLFLFMFPFIFVAESHMWSSKSKGTRETHIHTDKICRRFVKIFSYEDVLCTKRIFRDSKFTISRIMWSMKFEKIDDKKILVRKMQHVVKTDKKGRPVL